MRRILRRLSYRSPFSLGFVGVVRFPPPPLPKSFLRKDLGILFFLVAADRQRTGCPDCQALADSVTELSPDLRYINERWHLLQPHVREAILTLVDASLAQQALEGGQS